MTHKAKATATPTNKIETDKATETVEMTTTPTATKASPEKPKQPKENGVTRPSAGTTTGRVWEIADNLSNITGEPAVRKDVLEKTRAEGIKDATASTQYGRWRKFHGLGKETSQETPAAEAPTMPDTATVPPSAPPEAPAVETNSEEAQAAAEAVPAAEDTTVV